MRKPRTVRRRCSEADTEHLIIIIIFYQKNPCRTLLMSEKRPFRMNSNGLFILKFYFRFSWMNIHICSPIRCISNFITAYYSTTFNNSAKQLYIFVQKKSVCRKFCTHFYVDMNDLFLFSFYFIKVFFCKFEYYWA